MKRLKLSSSQWSTRPSAYPALRSTSTRRTVAAYQVAVSPDEARIVALFGRMESKGSLLALVDTAGEALPTLIELPEGVREMHFSPDGDTILLYDRTLNRFGFRAASGTGEATSWFEIPRSRGQGATRLAYGGAERIFLACDHEIDQFRLVGDDATAPDRMELVRSFRHPAIVSHLALSPDGKILAIADVYPSVSVFGLHSLSLTHWAPLEQLSQIHFDGSSRRLIAVGDRPGVAGVDYSLRELS